MDLEDVDKSYYNLFKQFKNLKYTAYFIKNKKVVA